VVASVPVTEGVLTPLFTEEAPDAYVLVTVRLADFYVPFVPSTAAQRFRPSKYRY
jgi:hypothetical protein